MSQHSSRLGSGRTGSQGHSWCDTDPARPGQTLHHFHKSLSLQSWMLSMACTVLLPGLGSFPDAFGMCKGGGTISRIYCLRPEVLVP